jgi:hypothetical protein
MPQLSCGCWGHTVCFGKYCNMICSKCKEEGRKSIVRGGIGSSTCIYCPPYYDEEGVYHHHDDNWRSYEYTCSNGHRITVSSTGKCPNCKWGHDNQIISVRDTEKQELTADSSGTIKIDND